MKMCLANRVLAAVLIVVLVADQRAEGLPYRRKRTSDQRLAELEAYIGMSKMKGQMITVPIAFGRVNLDEIGRRRRSARPYPPPSLEDAAVDSAGPQDDDGETLDDLLRSVEKSRPYQWDAY